MAKELVSIVVLNWNGKGDAEKCIRSIKENTVYRNYEIIVVDNGSKDGSVELLKGMKERGMVQKLVLNKSNLGFGVGNNRGMEQAKGDYVFLLNNDTIVTRGWLQSLVEAAGRKKKAGIIGVWFPNIDKQGTIFGGGYIDDSGRARNTFGRGEGFAEQVSGGAFLIRRGVIERVGFFDKGFSPIYFEESDYCARARKAGFKVLFTPKSKILHTESASTKRQTSKWRYVTINKNRLRYMLIHFTKKRLVKGFFWEMLRFLKALAGLKAHWLAESWLANLRALPEIAGKRRAYAKGKVFLGARQ